MNYNKFLTNDQNILYTRLRQMKLSGMADAFESQAKNPNSELDGFEARFEAIVNYEWELRFNKKLNRYIKKATLRYPQADFDDSIYAPDRLLDTEAIEKLSACNWIEDGRNLIITGATGTGKSYLSNALCIAALRKFKTVKYIRANTLMNEFEQARVKSCYCSTD